MLIELFILVRKECMYIDEKNWPQLSRKNLFLVAHDNDGIRYLLGFCTAGAYSA